MVDVSALDSLQTRTEASTDINQNIIVRPHTAAQQASGLCSQWPKLTARREQRGDRPIVATVEKQTAYAAESAALRSIGKTSRANHTEAVASQVRWLQRLTADIDLFRTAARLRNVARQTWLARWPPTPASHLLAAMPRLGMLLRKAECGSKIVGKARGLRR